MSELTLNALLDRCTIRQRKFVFEYCTVLNRTEAARRAGFSFPFSAGQRMFNRKEYTHVAEAAEALLKDQERRSELKGEYVRNYILDVLELCPTDYFDIAPDGGWEISKEKFQALPREVKRLIEDVEVSYYRDGRSVLSVKFVSKAAALGMAARYTLLSKVLEAAKGVPWDEVVANAPDPDRDPQELRLLGDGSERAEGPVQAKSSAVA